MLKFALRRNLIYPLQLIIWNLVRKLETILIGFLFNFSNSLFYTPIMFIGEFLSGLLIYLYQKQFLKKQKEKPKFFNITLITAKTEIIAPDSRFKIYLLILFVAYFDWIQFMIWTAIVPKYFKISGSIVSRLSGILTISDALFYYYVLRLAIFKHQLLSLIIIGICLIIILLTEFIFQEINIFLTYSEFVIVLVLTFFCEILGAILDAIEKYLFEYDFINPFYTLMLEGAFGFFMSFLYFCIPGYLDDLSLVYKNFSSGELAWFILLIILYIILSGGRNVYRVITTKIYSPMARSLTDYFLNPIYLTVDFILKNDFINKEERNFAYFIINLVLSFIISICGCVYNEFLILFFCGLEHETHNQISKRANIFEELSEIIDDSDSQLNEYKQ